MLTVADECEPIAPTEAELDGLGELNRLLQDRGSLGWTLIVPGGEHVVHSEATLHALRQAVDALARDQAVVVRRMTRDLTPDQAADLLNVQHAEVVRLLDAGALTSRTIRGRDRIRCEDVLTFKRQRDAERRELLRQLSAQGQEIEALLE